MHIHLCDCCVQSFHNSKVCSCFHCSVNACFSRLLRYEVLFAITVLNDFDIMYSTAVTTFTDTTAICNITVLTVVGNCVLNYCQ